MYSIVNSRVGPLDFETGAVRAAARRKLFRVVSAADTDGGCAPAALNTEHDITTTAKRFLFDMIFPWTGRHRLPLNYYYEFREPIELIRRITRSNHLAGGLPKVIMQCRWALVQICMSCV